MHYLYAGLLIVSGRKCRSAKYALRDKINSRSLKTELCLKGPTTLMTIELACEVVCVFVTGLGSLSSNLTFYVYII